jgi:TRAP-type C4-dicarboxylate transport system substrate-binding protein
VVSNFPRRSDTMHGMELLRRPTALLTVAVASAALAAAGCSDGSAEAGNKAGGANGPVVLELANTNGDIDFTPAVADFVNTVDELSGGRLRIEVVDEWADGAPDAEQQVVKDVAAGDVDLGWVGTRVFDTMGITSFQALSAPMLVDSYLLENAVIESRITKEMMGGLGELGVSGLGVLPDGLRRPASVQRPIRGPADWQGITFGTLMSNAQADAIRALGARPDQVHRKDREDRLREGKMQGFETSLWVHQHNPALTSLAPYVTSNVNLWPQMDVLLGNPSRLDSLTDEQRAWLERAARGAATVAPALAAIDAKALSDTCAGGGRFARASDEDVAALEAAFAPVYAKLQHDSQTRGFIDRIKTLKQSTPPDQELAIPADCTGIAPGHAAGSTGTAPAWLNGTYRFMLTQADADRVGDKDTGYPDVQTIRLKDGRLEGGCFGSLGATYSVDADRIMFHAIEYDNDLTVAFTVDDQGSLHLKPVPPMDAGDAFTCFYKPWTKIE